MAKMDGAEDEILPLPIDWQLGCKGMNDRVGRILAKQQWTDCSFLVGAEPPDEQKAHKLILAVASPVFEAMFYGLMAEQDPYRIRVPDIEPEVFEDMLKFIYTDKFDWGFETDLNDLYLAAQKYMLPGLMQKIVNFHASTLDAENVCEIYEFALFHKLKDLVTRCENMIMLITNLVLWSDSFFALKIETVLRIFSFESLNASELQLIDAAHQWLTEKKPLTSLDVTDKPQQQSEVSEAVTVSLKSDPIAKRGKKRRRRGKRGGTSKVAKTQNSMDCHCGRKEEIPDRPILPLLHKIRFLTLTHKEICENKNIPTLLTNKEMLAILNNVVADPGKNTLEIPEGFSTSRSQRGETQETFIGTLPWKMIVIRHLDPDCTPKDSLGVFLEFVGQCTKDWSCFVLMETKLLSHVPDVPDLSAEHNVMFKNYVKCWGSKMLVSWEDLMKIESPYVKDDSITAEIRVVATSEIKPVKE